MLQRVRLGTHHLSDLQYDEAAEQNWVFTALTNVKAAQFSSAMPCAQHSRPSGFMGGNFGVKCVLLGTRPQ